MIISVFGDYGSVPIQKGPRVGIRSALIQIKQRHMTNIKRSLNSGLVHHQMS